MAMDWERLMTGVGPGLVQGIGGMLGGNMAVKEADRRSAEARGAAQPYSQAALDQLLQAQQFSTSGNAAERYKQQMGLMQPGQENDRLKMMRMLQAKGLLGSSTNAPATGIAEGTGHNPLMSSLLGAQETARQQAAARALDDSQNTLNQMVTRSAALQQGAGAAQGRMQASQPSASKASMFGEMFKGLGGMLGNKDVMSSIFGAFKGNNQPQAASTFQPFSTNPSLQDLDPSMGWSDYSSPIRYDDWSGSDYGSDYSYGSDNWY